MLNRKKSLAVIPVMLLAILIGFSSFAWGDMLERASVNGKYSELIQELKCPADQAKYGHFKDYGWWGGGPWCGQQGKAGYWVWVAPTWYVWAGKGVTSNVPEKAAVNGKYSELVQVLNCPADKAKYGHFKDYGWWGGGPWCGQQGKAGYWVWVAPNWYVWKHK
jgi:hypothetical protein